MEISNIEVQGPYKTTTIYTYENDQILNVFPAKIMVSDIELSDNSIEKIYEFTDKFRVPSSSTRGQSEYEQVLSESFLKPLNDYILNKARKFLNFNNQQSCEDLQICNSWLNVLNGNQSANSIRYHNHPNSYISGCIYLTDDNSDIFFKETLRNHWNFNSDWENPETISIQPKKGQVILFPSNLYHGVEETKKDRRSLCFNIIPLGNFGTTTCFINFGKVGN